MNKRKSDQYEDNEENAGNDQTMNMSENEEHARNLSKIDNIRKTKRNDRKQTKDK